MTDKIASNSGKHVVIDLNNCSEFTPFPLGRVSHLKVIGFGFESEVKKRSFLINRPSIRTPTPDTKVQKHEYCVVYCKHTVIVSDHRSEFADRVGAALQITNKRGRTRAE